MVPKVVTLNDPERRNGDYLALYHQIRQLRALGPITSKWLKLNP